ncbi:hypothetical protein CE10_0303 [Escherichia coli O7:K1 str. CE10]|nr:hypothetical protein CE10_0303 [Escherichia coli O7:K1 str. CE10]
MRRCLMRRLPRLIMPTYCFYTDNFSPTFFALIHIKNIFPHENDCFLSSDE